MLIRMTHFELGYDISTTEDEKFKFVVSVAKSEIEIQEIRNWISAKLILNPLQHRMLISRAKNIENESVNLDKDALGAAPISVGLPTSILSRLRPFFRN